MLLLISAQAKNVLQQLGSVEAFELLTAIDEIGETPTRWQVIPETTFFEIRGCESLVLPVIVGLGELAFYCSDVPNSILATKHDVEIRRIAPQSRLELLFEGNFVRFFGNLKSV